LTTILKNSILTAEIKHFGAELISLKTNFNKEYIWEGNSEFWGKHSPILFPIVGSLKNNSFHHNETEYHLSRHGFARDMEFELIEATENSATFTLQSSAETVKVYPFEFELQIIYTLDKNNLSIAYNVFNKGKSRMPFSIGAHPAFALPNQFENYAIAFEKKESLDYYLLENDLTSNKTKKLEVHNKQVPLAYELFEDDALIFKTIKSKSVTILENENPFLRVHFEDFPSLGIWTKMKAPFICIEPWFGYADTTENSGNLFEKEGIQILESNATFHSKFNIEIL
jgi:galactose mutarotase-like enzyme